MCEEELKNNRKTIKAGVTRIYKFIRDFKNDDMEQIEIRDNKLEELWAKYDDVQTKLEYLNLENESDRDTFETSYYNTKCAIKKIINTATKTTVPNNTKENKEPVKLPHINIPIFSGDYQSWQSFHDIFESLINQNSSVPKIQKFYYLKSQLKGEALQIIDSITVCADNYDEAWKLLVERFNNKQYLVNTHIKALFELPQIPKESVTGLRSLLNETKQHLRSLKSLGRPTDSWDDVMIYLISQKLDNQCRREWELCKDANTQQLPKLEELYTFLEKRCFSLEAIGATTAPDKTKTHKSINSHHSTQNSNSRCKLCGDFHALYKCLKFLKQDPNERTETVKRLRVCFNCLRDSHSVAQCTSTSLCRLCHRKHHTSIHIERVNNDQDRHRRYSGSQKSESQTSASNEQITNPKQNFALQQLHKPSEVLLATAVVNVRDIQGKWQQCRALLDSASQTNFVTTNLVERLGLNTRDKYIPVGGIGQICTEVNRSVLIHISSRVSNYNKRLEFLILDKITNELPTIRINLEKWNLPTNIELADPNFNIPGEIDMLIGAEIFLSILKGCTIKISNDIPPIQNTKLGSIVSGRVQHCLVNTFQPICLRAGEAIETQMRRFWEIEEVYKKHLSQEEVECEKHFEENTSRDETGRYIVKLPFKEIPEQTLGNSYTTALQRFKKLENKFKQSDDFKQQYQQFLQEYLQLGHMKEVLNEDTSEGYYLPHHAVLKETSLSTKIRVVFDASAATDSGLSLNSALMVGPTIQEDLFNILLRFRTHRYVITADIEKMYRQILVERSDTKYQKILWRVEENQPIKTYELQTVTYGTACAPYLAIRSLIQLANDEQENFPLASSTIKRDFYVDDVLTGGKTLEHTERIRDQLSKLLQKGGFRLRKWSSNEPKLLQGLEDTSDDPLHHLDTTQTLKTLGLQWNASQDVILYKLNFKHDQEITKRGLLSHIAKLYDPLGLLGPIICKAKIIMQQLWQSKIEWDDPVPEEILSTWKTFSLQLEELKRVRIPRRVITIEPKNTQIHGFCDASEQAYGACIYLRTCNDTNYEIHLLCSKSKVAPLKRISLPRLELCGALLLSHLLETVIEALDVHIDKTVLWSDSTITLAWIRTPAHKLKTFIANRVSEIQRLTNVNDWKWTSTKHNPADIISRGCNPIELIEHEQWWRGPSWVLQDETEWPNENFVLDVPNEIFEYKPAKPTCLISVYKWDIYSKYSDLVKLQRVTATCLRFLNLPDRNKQRGPLTVRELKYALHVLIRRAQLEEFREDIRSLTKNEELPSGSKLKSLTPFIDNEGLLRVGGRIQNTNLCYDKKHQLILPATHLLTKLIIQHAHICTLHAGTQALLNHVRQTYWPINGRNIIKRTIHQCYKCFKLKIANTQQNQLMGNLPKYRFETVRPFINVGIDYGGPVLVRSSKLRNASLLKSYIALFICMTTRAIHLELVSGLSTSDFMAAFRRFMARRGKPANMYSDNATNFQGANNELRELQKYFRRNQDHLATDLARESVQWHFIPPNAPNFGGLWESGIKSVKYHIKRVVGETRLTFEEMYTLLTIIESCVNSRPITPIYDDPTDITALTPGHFLTLAPLTQIPDPNLIDLNPNRLTRWQLVQQMSQHFWSRWSQEYLHHLQQRHKWFRSQPNLKIGDVVILKEDNTSPLTWKLGRVEETHPGGDGRIRVVTVRTKAGTIKRAVSKLAPLPLEE